MYINLYFFFGKIGLCNKSQNNLKSFLFLFVKKIPFNLILYEILFYRGKVFLYYILSNMKFFIHKILLFNQYSIFFDFIKNGRCYSFV